ncbi:MAG: hypothetical protein ACHP78_16155 [Terriglobales bacterium]
MTIKRVEIERFSVTSFQRFEAVVAALKAKTRLGKFCPDWQSRLPGVYFANLELCQPPEYSSSFFIPASSGPGPPGPNPTASRLGLNQRSCGNGLIPREFNATNNRVTLVGQVA